MSNSKKVNEKWSKKDYQKSSKRVYSRSDKAITLIALIVTIIVLLILAGVTINLAVNNQGIFNKAKTATGAYKNASEGERTGLDEADKEIAKYMPKEGTEGGSDSETGSGSITYTDSAGKTQTLKKDTPAGTKIGTTANISGKDGETGVNLDWYLFDISDDGKTAYLVSTPTWWVPDTTKEVRGAWVPKLVSSSDENTGATRQAIQKKASGTSWSSYTYEKATYTPSDNTLNYFKSVNSDWAKSENGRSTQEFSKWNENEQAACYLADADIFKGIKDQVNNAGENLKGKIQTLVGGASDEQWCKAYNKQAIVKEKQPNGGITCKYRATNTPGYIYRVNGNQSDSNPASPSLTDYWAGRWAIYGNDIYGAAANKNAGTLNDNNPFYTSWWLASPSAAYSYCLNNVNGNSSDLYYSPTNICFKMSLFASVSL